MTTRVRPVVSLPGKRRATADANNRLSTCKRCRLGIFKSQSYEWGTGRFLGLIHTDCIEGETS